jgi:hypothetical protein
MMRLAMFLMIAMCAATAAQAETWKAELERTADSKPKCPDVPIIFELSATGADISVAAVGNAPQSARVAADGAVSFQFSSASGTSTISGNARTKDLRFVPRFLEGCFYTLKPLSAEAAQQLVTWSATIQQIGGNVTTCSSGSRGSVLTRGRSLMLFGFNLGNRPVLGVRLAEDGSADVDTNTAFGRNSTARVKVAAGTGPRLMGFVTYTNVCNYRIIPD